MRCHRRLGLSFALIGCALVARGAIGCAGNDQATARDAGDLADAADAAVATCCQIEIDDTDASLWQNCRFGCHTDAGVSLHNIPWVCNMESPSPTSCDDPKCVVGVACRGFNGRGHVVPCDDPAPPTGPTPVAATLCP